MDRTITLLSILLSLIIIMTGFFAYQITSIEAPRVDRVPINFKVDRVIGLAGDTDRLNFGTVTPGGIVQKSINISSDKPVRAELLVEGPAEEYVSLSRSTVDIDPGFSEKILVTVKVPKSVESGSFSGELVVHYGAR